MAYYLTTLIHPFDSVVTHCSGPIAGTWPAVWGDGVTKQVSENPPTSSLQPFSCPSVVPFSPARSWPSGAAAAPAVPRTAPRGPRPVARVSRGPVGDPRPTSLFGVPPSTPFTGWLHGGGGLRGGEGQMFPRIASLFLFDSAPPVVQYHWR